MTLARLDNGTFDCVAGRTESFSWEAYKADGITPQAFNVDDTVRFKLGTFTSGTPSIDIESGTPSDAGSEITIDVRGQQGVTPASGTLVLDQDDTKFLTGTMHFEICLIDVSDLSRIKPFIRGKFRMLQSQGGPID